MPAVRGRECAAGPPWSVPSGNRRNSFHCNYIMQNSISPPKLEGRHSSIRQLHLAPSARGRAPSKEKGQSYLARILQKREKREHQLLKDSATSLAVSYVVPCHKSAIFAMA